MINFIIIIFLSAFVQGMTSFGFSLVAMPLLAWFLPLKTIVPLLVICSLALNSVIFTRIKGHLHLRRILILLVVGMISTPLGVYLLRIVDERILKGGVGLLIVLTAAVLMTGYQFRFVNKTITYGVTGFMSGVLNGSVSLSGPPVVLMLVNEGEEKNDFKKNISGYFLALNIVTVPSFIIGGLITPQIVSYSFTGMVAVIIGALLGIKVGNEIKSVHFRKIVLFMISIMGITTLASVFP